MKKDFEPLGREDFRATMRMVANVLKIIAILVVIFLVIHAWYVDTHCTMIFGTQVCQ